MHCKSAASAALSEPPQQTLMFDMQNSAASPQNDYSLSFILISHIIQLSVT